MMRHEFSDLVRAPTDYPVKLIETHINSNNFLFWKFQQIFIKLFPSKIYFNYKQRLFYLMISRRTWTNVPPKVGCKIDGLHYC